MRPAVILVAIALASTVELAYKNIRISWRRSEVDEVDGVEIKHLPQ